jgi:hypothetical protein
MDDQLHPRWPPLPETMVGHSKQLVTGTRLTYKRVGAPQAFPKHNEIERVYDVPTRYREVVLML